MRGRIQKARNLFCDLGKILFAQVFSGGVKWVNQPHAKNKAFYEDDALDYEQCGMNLHMMLGATAPMAHD